jgi:hypothetical protein
MVASSAGLGCVKPLFFLDLGQQLVYFLRGIDPHEPAAFNPNLHNGPLTTHTDVGLAEKVVAPCPRGTGMDQ